MRSILNSLESEYRRYKTIAEAAVAQLTDDELVGYGSDEGNSIAVIAWHIAGNLTSRFTDFLSDDGEKPWRKRDEEFARRNLSREELMEHWEGGWRLLFDSLGELSEAHLHRAVRIRGVEIAVHDALHRSLAHTSYHVGQIVYLARASRGSKWEYLSIPPGGSAAYNSNPTTELADAHTSKLKDFLGD